MSLRDVSILNFGLFFALPLLLAVFGSWVLLLQLGFLHFFFFVAFFILLVCIFFSFPIRFSIFPRKSEILQEEVFSARNYDYIIDFAEIRVVGNWNLFSFVDWVCVIWLGIWSVSSEISNFDRIIKTISLSLISFAFFFFPLPRCVL